MPAGDRRTLPCQASQGGDESSVLGLGLWDGGKVGGGWGRTEPGTEAFLFLPVSAFCSPALAVALGLVQITHIITQFHRQQLKILFQLNQRQSLFVARSKSSLCSDLQIQRQQGARGSRPCAHRSHLHPRQLTDPFSRAWRRPWERAFPRGGPASTGPASSCPSRTAPDH